MIKIAKGKNIANRRCDKDCNGEKTSQIDDVTVVAMGVAYSLWVEERVEIVYLN